VVLTGQRSSGRNAGIKRVDKIMSSGNMLWKTLLFSSMILPTGFFTHVAAAVGGDNERLSLSPAVKAISRRLSNTTVPYTLADDPAALAVIRSKLTTCKYSKGRECVDDVTSLPEFGVYRQGPGMCVAFDTSYVNVTYPLAALPNRYLPISVEEGNEQGFQNRFSRWSSTNQEQFQVDCPLLYHDTVANGQDLLCCTENQYESLRKQVRMINSQCTSCTENLRNVWCQFACNPNNSMFIEVDQVRLMAGDENHTDAVFPAIEEATYYVGSDVVRDIYDYCEKIPFSRLYAPQRRIARTGTVCWNPWAPTNSTRWVLRCKSM
jgi:hypothetical protein